MLSSLDVPTLGGTPSGGLHLFKSYVDKVYWCFYLIDFLLFLFPCSFPSFMKSLVWILSLFLACWKTGEVVELVRGD